jgi:hypothetical protein
MKPLYIAAVALAATTLVAPARGAVLYKSVDEKGVIQFSDLPPDKGVDVKKIVVPETTAAVPGAMRPAEVIAAAPVREEQIRFGDEGVQRASMQVDLAEHALAVARRPLWEIADPMKLEGPRLTRGDRDRLDYYRKNLKIAQQQLADVLRSRLKEAATMTAEAGAPIYGPVGPTYRR